MIERLRDSSGFGLKVSGSITAEDVKAIEPQIQREIAESRKKPIGILIDLTLLQSMEWKARWEELRFLAKFGGPIARVAVIGARQWEELEGEVAGATVLMQADIRYFQPSEIMHAWHWMKTAKYAEDLPVRTMLPPGHLMSGYNTEYTDV
jgi:hypothetical protein